MTSLTIESVGVLALLQDRGRRGLAHLGVGRSGAADRTSYDLANRLVGNQPGAACIETVFGRIEIRFDTTVLVAVTGAPVTIRCGGREQAINSAFTVFAGETMALGAASDGLRTYIAVRGGIEGDRVLGSASWDTMAHIGTPPLRAGDVLKIGDRCADWPPVDCAPVAASMNSLLELPLLLGPRDDWFADEAIECLATARFTVSPDADRVGIRLDGPPLARRRPGELASEGVVVGALQVPTNGRPTLFMPDAPVTGGYPVIGVVPRSGVDRAAQAVPGARIRFKPVRPSAVNQ
ncbi:allophanate hydrolase [Mycolicibacterium agri]|uniref:Allophanate hydrolase n=1 Tax=Mycolicibacterium agri TaxID=36811 RepID=A0A2A7N3V5_MYCAG|nr:biotin-dependent carboxyltransferase family protein [Mycolicibacterium agri]PEG38576.1 allophanate hydrolase [Mycolicibacterium agri]GFG53561.1 allophanate hydrolase [Mycolicibacterium agri]